MKHPTPHEPQPDGLRSVYLDAVAEDRGPDVASSERILAYARQQAKARHGSAHAAAAQHGPADLEKPAASQASPQPAANDRQWRRHALGGMVTLGLVGWLMLQTTWWGDASHGAHPAPAAETLSPSAEMSTDRTASTSPAAAPPAPMPQPSSSASARRHDSLAETKKNQAMEQSAPAEHVAKTMPSPQERQTNAAASKLAPTPLPWCPDSTANMAADAQAFSKEGDAPSAATTPPTCRPRPKNQPAQP
ncbi:MAG: hypothetical protein LBV14_16910 [Acidovorax sp.]|jgi:hypothetical protein|nr:hypothetical protein [Acidovorax sp.]